MIHYYLKKGITHEKLLGLNVIERAFYVASMEIEIEEERLNRTNSES